MGLPEILINFETLANTAITRSSKGVVALIVKDSTVTTFDTKIYKASSEIVATDWTETNLDYIKKTFLGSPSKVIVERVASDALDYSTALARLKNKVWDYLAVPGIETADVANISTWIIDARTDDKKTFKAVLPNSTSNNEGIINFTTSGIVVGSTTYDASDYTCRIAGILAGLPLSRSATYYVLDEVESITDSTDPDTDIDAGKLILVNDGTKCKIGRAVNSLTTTTDTKGASFKKIKIVETVDMMTNDIKNTFSDNYVGKVINNYDNKIIFVGAVNAYLKSIAEDDMLDVNYNNKAQVDLEAQRVYLESISVVVDDLTDEEIKEYNTDSKLFVSANVKIADAMEDLTFAVYM